MKPFPLITTLLIAFLSLRIVPAADTPTFVHPGGWITVADIQRVRAQLAANAEPWTDAKNKLLSTGPSTDYKPHAVAVVTRAGGGVDQGGNSELKSQASDAYTLMIKWVATNDPRYADAAIRIIDAWSETLTEIKGSDARLAAGIYGNKFAEAAELAAYYKPDWPNKARAQAMFRNVFFPVIKDGASSNWGTSCMAGIISMGVFCDDRPMFDEAVDAYQHGWPIKGHDGCAAVTQYIDDTGQCAETGRDQPHPQGGIGHLIETAVVAWHQGINLFPYGNNRLVLGLEYTAKYNLGNDVPFHQFVDPAHLNDHWTSISTKGRGQFSPIYEMAMAYFTLAGTPAPYTRQICELPSYTPERTNIDHPGLGTLMFRLVPGAPMDPAPPAPKDDSAAAAKSPETNTTSAPATPTGT